MYLALPHLGCLLVLTLVACLLLRHGRHGRRGSHRDDSRGHHPPPVLLLGHAWTRLAPVPGDPRPARHGLRGHWMDRLPVVLVTPWIDERFVLALPLCLLLRDRFLASPRRRRPVPRGEELAGGQGPRPRPCSLDPASPRRPRCRPRRGDRRLARPGPWLPGANAPFYLLGLWEGLRWALGPSRSWQASRWRGGRGAGPWPCWPPSSRSRSPPAWPWPTTSAGRSRRWCRRSCWASALLGGADRGSSRPSSSSPAPLNLLFPADGMSSPGWTRAGSVCRWSSSTRGIPRRARPGSARTPVRLPRRAGATRAACDRRWSRRNPGLDARQAAAYLDRAVSPRQAWTASRRPGRTRTAPCSCGPDSSRRSSTRP